MKFDKNDLTEIFNKAVKEVLFEHASLFPKDGPAAQQAASEVTRDIMVILCSLVEKNRVKEGEALSGSIEEVFQKCTSPEEAMAGLGQAKKTLDALVASEIEKADKDGREMDEHNKQFIKAKDTVAEVMMGYLKSMAP